MTELYRIPRLQVPAQVLLVGCESRRLDLFLGLCAPSHSGYERPSDLLNGREAFLPAGEPDGRVVFLQLDAVQAVTVEAKYEFGPEDLLSGEGGATRLQVEVALIGGAVQTGWLTYVLPQGRQRLQDFLNQAPGRFFVLQDGAYARLVHKQHVLFVQQV